jgi:hypothetical protein
MIVRVPNLQMLDSLFLIHSGPLKVVVLCRVPVLLLAWQERYPPNEKVSPAGSLKILSRKYEIQIF